MPHVPDSRSGSHEESILRHPASPAGHPASAGHSPLSATAAHRSLSGSLLAELRRLLGPEGVIAEPDRLVAYESDALTLIRGCPSAALFPRTTEELQRVVRLLAAAEVPFVPRGSGTGLAGGAVAHGEALICTTRMDRILELDPAARRATVQPGVVTDRITEAARPHGLRYLPDPSSAPACSVGGNVALNAGGPHCLMHGVTADHVTGLRVVLPDGRLLEPRRGEDGGLDLAALFIGSEGTLGIVAEIDVRLFPTAPAVQTGLAVFPRLADAGAAVSAVLASGAIPVALELVDRATIRLVEDSPYAIGLPSEAEAVLVLEFEGEPREATAGLELAAEAARAGGATEIRIAANEKERARLWRARKKAYGLLGRQAPEILVQDAVVPRTALPDLLPQIEAIAHRHRVRLSNFFHAGDGNLHPNLIFDRRDPEEVDRVARANDEILEVCVETGGTITGEHGVGLDKKEAMRLIFKPAELDRMRAIKALFDPRGLCNAGKMLPEA